MLTSSHPSHQVFHNYTKPPKKQKKNSSRRTTMAAQNKNSTKCQGLWHKILSPFRTRPTTHQSQPSISVASDTKPVHQPSLSKMVPIEDDHQHRQKPAFADERKRKGRNFDEREIIITNGQKLGKAKSRKDDHHHDANHEKKFSSYIDKVKDRMMRTVSSHVGGAAGGGGGGSVGGSGGAGGGGGGATARRDSFNDKATNFINRARVKIRATTSVQDERNISFK